MQIKPTTTINPVRIQSQKANFSQFEKDSVAIENSFVNKKPLVDRKIIPLQKNINEFFDEISAQIFEDSNAKYAFQNLLKKGCVSLSSSAYSNLKDPKSAIAIKLDPAKNAAIHCAQLEQYLQNGVGVGINFSQFKNPIYEIKYLNDYFKFREPNLNRPSAGIALLNVNHPRILDFITLKNDADYQNWCFDLSVILDDEFLNKVDNNSQKEIEIYQTLLESMKKSGEPGVIFSSDKDFICDCCAAAKLNENEGLNLTQINLAKFYNPKTHCVDFEFLSQSADVLSNALQKIAPNGFISVLGYQDLLNQLGLKYGSSRAIEVLEECLQTIKKQTSEDGIRLAISPSGTISRVLNVTPALEPSPNSDVFYQDEINTLGAAQKYLDGGISKTILLDKNTTLDDVDAIIRRSHKVGIKGISVFPVG